MVLIVTIGSLFQARSLSWGLLFTEFGLILLPTLIFFWLGRQSPRAVLRLRWPGGRLVLLGALIGVGVWGLDIGLQGLMTTVLGYAPASVLSTLPTDPLNLVVFVTAMVLAAPLCEEVLFRGYLLSAYGRFAPRVALVAVGLLFAFYHLQFSGLVALLPIALVLGVLAHRANSLAPSVAAHLANNALGAAVAVTTRLNPGLVNGSAFTAAMCGLMLVGPIIALVSLWAYLRLTRPAPAVASPVPASPAPAPQAPAPVGPGAFWPLGVAAVLYVVLASLEVLVGRFPHVLASRALSLEPAPWTEPTHLAYNLWNVANESVGRVNCRLTPEGDVVVYDCVGRQWQFEVKQGQSIYAGGQYELHQAGRWDAASMRLLEAQLDFEGQYGDWSANVSRDGAGDLSLTLPGAAPVSLPADTVLMAEWPYEPPTPCCATTMAWASPGPLTWN